MQEKDSKIAALKEFRQGMDGLNDFQLFGVTPECKDSDVRSAYFGLLKKYGADFFHDVDEATMEDVNAVNKRLRDAYQNLQTAEKRAMAATSLSSDGGEDGNANAEVDLAAVFEAEQALTRARNLMERGDFELSLKHLRTALEKDPQNTETQTRIAYAEFILAMPGKDGKRPPQVVGKAREALDNAIKAWPNDADMVIFRAEIEKLEGDVDKALDYYKKAVKLSNSPIAQREIQLIESRKKAEEEKKNAPPSFIDKLKEQFSTLFKKK